MRLVDKGEQDAQSAGPTLPSADRLSYPYTPHADSTRAVSLVATGVGRNLPIEAKLYDPADLWFAAVDELQG